MAAGGRTANTSVRGNVGKGQDGGSTATDAYLTLMPRIDRLSARLGGCESEEYSLLLESCA